MSDSRKILTAKRKDDRAGSSQKPTNQEISNSQRGTKRPNFNTPSKNLANDRLKRLRTSLTEEVQKHLTPPNKTSSNVPNKHVKSNKNKKRPQSDLQKSTCVAPKQQKTNIAKQEAFVFKENFEKNFAFGTSTAPFFGKCDISVPSTVGEDMDWCPVEAGDLSVSAAINLPTCSTDCGDTKAFQNEFVIVVDTNIFLSHLQTIKQIMSVQIMGDEKLLVFIPWIVLEELDFIKEDSRNSSLRFKAQEAIKYIEKCLSERHKRIRGQTLEEANQQKSVGKSQDNKIIATCLQVLEKNSNMVLFTADINLKNKAHFNNIPVCSHTEIMGRISRLRQTKYQRIVHKMTNLFGNVIEECARNAYGPAASKMGICQTPLQSMQDCISVFTRYWFPVFQEVLMKQFRKAIEDLSKFLSKNQVINDSGNELEDFVRLCVRVCLFLKDVECCKSSIENTICDLNNIKES